MEKIKFQTGSSSPFFTSLDKEVDQLMEKTNLLKKAKRVLYIKTAFYILVFAAAYSSLYIFAHSTFWSLTLNYVLVGLTGILLAFNVSHDACHGSFSKSKKINYWMYHLTFNLQGTNAYLWQLRHNASHHLFPNVDGCDADIDNNPFLRLSPQHPLKIYHRYQHIYAVVVYCIYSLHWFLFKDLFYLFTKKVANLQHKKHSVKEFILLFFWKAVYVTFLVVIPVMYGYDLGNVLLAFAIMHVCLSLFFIHVLIATHLCMETQFPQVDAEGNLPGDYYTHQLATSLDYSPTSKVYNWFLGGFNAHAAHHLYPKLPHTTYAQISVLIERKAKEFNIPYNKLSMVKAIISHYRFLKMMGKNSESQAEKSESNYIRQIKRRVFPNSLLACFCFLVSMAGHSQANFAKYLSKDSIVHKFESLKTGFAVNKVIPKELELECLTALSYYPELKEAKIIFKFGSPISTMVSRPKLKSFLRSGYEREYEVIIKQPGTSKNGLEWNELSFNSLVGWIAHELGHISHYIKKTSAGILFTGVKYAFPGYRRRMERFTDNLVVQHDLGNALFEGTDYCINNPGTNPHYKKVLRKYYLSPNEIKNKINMKNIYRANYGATKVVRIDAISKS